MESILGDHKRPEISKMLLIVIASKITWFKVIVLSNIITKQY